MSRFRRNVVANFGGQAAATVIALVTVPFFVKYLGPQGFGLVSFFLTFQALAGILDFGLSTTANREVSRHRSQQGTLVETRSLVRTLEVFYAMVAGFIFVAGTLAAPWLAEQWLQADGIAPATLQACLILGTGSLALRWPISLYQGVLRGLEHQVELNVLNALSALLRGLGTVAVLAFISREVLDFFRWQAIFSGVELVLFANRTWYSLRGPTALPSAPFNASMLRRLWGYAAQVGGVSLFAMLLKQLDKVIISRLLPIEHLGYYNAASLASNGLGKLVQPVQVAVFPRLSGLHAKQAMTETVRLFHQSCQTAAFLVGPAACVLLYFPTEILTLWTGSDSLAHHTGPTLSVLALAMLLNCQMNVIFALQLASAMAWLPLMANLLGLAVLGPALFWLVPNHGLIGAALCWLLFNLLNFAIVPPLTLRKLLPGEYWRWLTRDTLPFMLTPLACFGLARWASYETSLPIKGLSIAAAGLVYVGITVTISPEVRRLAQRSFRQSPAPLA